MKAFLFCATLYWVAEGLGGEDLATQVIRTGEQKLRGRSTQAAMTMVVKKPEFTRKLRLRSWTVGDARALVEILEPSKEEGIASLRVTNQMWNYLPKTDQVVRVPTSLMLQSWMGSDFTNDDLMKSSSLLRDYRHKVVKVQKAGSDKIVIIDCYPKPDAPVVWGRVQYWARLSDSLPVKQIYYDDKGKWIRTLSFGRFRKMDDRVIPTSISVRVAESAAQSTTIVYEKILYDRLLSTQLFSQDLLRRTTQAGKDLSAQWSVARLPGSRAVQAGMRLPFRSR